jgi:hypothetical protein
MKKVYMVLGCEEYIESGLVQCAPKISDGVVYSCKQAAMKALKAYAKKLGLKLKKKSAKKIDVVNGKELTTLYRVCALTVKASVALDDIL